MPAGSSARSAFRRPGERKPCARRRPPVAGWPDAAVVLAAPVFLTGVAATLAAIAGQAVARRPLTAALALKTLLLTASLRQGVAVDAKLEQEIGRDAGSLSRRRLCTDEIVAAWRGFTAGFEHRR